MENFTNEELKTYIRKQFPYLVGDIKENRETFFNDVGKIFYTRSAAYKDIMRAYDLAKELFRNVYRDTGERYFEHLRSVALIQMRHLKLKERDDIIGGIMHDVGEDIPGWDLDRIEIHFGQNVAYRLEQVTNPPVEMFLPEEWKGSIKHSGPWEQAKTLRNDFVHRMQQQNMTREGANTKLPDRMHNMTTLFDPVRAEKIAAKTVETRKVYMPLSEKFNILVWELNAITLLHEREPDLKNWIVR